MYKLLFNKRNVIALLLLVSVFSVGAYLVRQKMHRQYTLVSQSVINGSTSGYQKFLNYYFGNYSRILEQLNYEWHERNEKGADINFNMNSLLAVDSTVVAIGLLDGDSFWSVYNKSIETQLPGMKELLQADRQNIQHSGVLMQRYLFIGSYEATEPQYNSGILVDLHRLHEKFIWDNIYTSVYQVIINQAGQCIYHPEINKVGKPYQLPAYLFSNGSYDYEQFNTLHEGRSDYLQLPAFKEYRSMPLGGEEWVIVSVSPGFEIKDMIAGQERNMILLFLLFLITLVVILIFGILHWKREFLLRSSAEQENLNLLLKNEKQKSETISIKLELLRSGLNSHFMFNSLGTVKALLSNDDKIARKMLSSLSHLYRYQLRIEGEHMVSLQDELFFTQTYVDVINLRMNSSIRMEINNLPAYLDRKVLPVSLQLLVENCIKHNIASEKNPLIITLEVRDDRIYVINELRPKVALVETNGKGLKNLNTRYSLISQQECTFKEENGQFIATIPFINEA